MEDTVTEVEELIEANDLQGLKRSVGNAWTMYVRTRPPAAQESVMRARALPKGGIHPLLAHALPSANLAGLEAQVDGVPDSHDSSPAPHWD